MRCGYFVLVNILLCRHYPMLKGLRFSGVSQDLAVSQTGNIAIAGSIKTSRQIIAVCESAIKELKSTCEVTRLPPVLTVNDGNIHVNVGKCGFM